MYDYYNVGALSYREGFRNGEWVVDSILTVVGWGGAENTDWINLFKIKI
jgi:hypothetical protein